METIRVISANNRFTEADWERCAATVSTGLAAGELDPHVLLVELEFVGIIINAGSSAGEDYYSFAHRTLLEYFAAEGLLDHESEWTKIIVKHMWCESGWEEVVRFAASVTDEPNELLNAIAKETGPATTPSRPLQWLDQF